MCSLLGQNDSAIYDNIQNNKIIIKGLGFRV